MKQLVIFLFAFINIVYGQSTETTAKTRFVNGLYIGTKQDSYFKFADSNAVFFGSDSVLRVKYKGQPKKIATTNYVDSSNLTRLPVVNVKSYGAVGNGIVDDWAAILAASIYAEQNNLTLYFPSGTYNTTGPLTRTASRTDTELFSVLFGENVKIKVVDTTNFSNTNRTVFFYATNNRKHTFSIVGGNVEIDGSNFISQAIASTSIVQNNSLNINCASLTIKNIFSNGYTNTDSHAIYVAGNYPTLNISNVVIDSVSRVASLNTTRATQALLIATQLGKTNIDNVTVKNIGNNSLTQDCDGIVVRGVVVVGDFVGGDFTISNSYILNSRGRAIKAQSSTVRIYNTKIEQSDLKTFNSVSSIDFLYGNGIVDNCYFVYGSNTLGTSFAPIAFQERVRFVDLVSQATNNTVLTKSQMSQFATVSSTTNTSASANIIIRNNTVLPFDTTITNVITRGFVEFPSNELLALPSSSQWSFTIEDNITYTGGYLLCFTGYTTGDLSNKLRFDISGNKNYGKGLEVFNPISGNRINNVKKYRLKNNSGWGNYFFNWTVDLARGATMPDNEFTIALASSTVNNGPPGLPSVNVALIQVGDSSSQGQMRRVIVGDSLFHSYTYLNNWVAQPRATSFFVEKIDSLSGGYTSWNLTKKKIDSIGALLPTTGSYTPIISNVTNVQASISNVCYWSRSGNQVTVSGYLEIDPISANTPTEFRLTLPITTNMTGGNSGKVAGTMAGLDGDAVGTVLADIAGNRASFRYTSSPFTSNMGLSFIFKYLIE